MTRHSQTDQLCRQLAEGETDNLWSTPIECQALSEQEWGQKIAPEWEEESAQLIGELNKVLTAKLKEVSRIETLERKVILLEEWCGRLEQVWPLLAPIASLAPEPYEVIKPLYVVVRAEGDQYIASFFDTNLSASGDTRTEAVDNLKDIVIATVEMLGEMDEGNLGPVPQQQKKVLGEFIRKKG